ncbi:unnamed protein product [Linum trigynum]|uniref:Uncharacterized protein n=1 Tax=Linum trigynum TaxID=586398 RepID=A0AAV2G2S7_9ROSI
MAAPSSSGTTALADKPPDTVGGRRPPPGSSSPDGESEKETVQAKKKVRPTNFDKTYPADEDGGTASMDTEEDSIRTQEATGTEGGTNSWFGSAKRLFSDVLKDETWYVEESDSEDVAQREKEEDNIPNIDDDPKCPHNPIHSGAEDKVA